MPTVPDIHRRGTRAAQGAATLLTIGTLWYVTDEELTERWTGTVWESYSGDQVPAAHAPSHEASGSDELTLAQSQVTDLVADQAAQDVLLAALDADKVETTDPRLTDARTPTAHAASHADGAADEVLVTALGGFPGGTASFLRADATFAAPAAGAARIGAIGLVIDGGASVITTGVKGFIEVPFAGTITGWTLLSTDAAVTTGNLVVDIWKAPIGSYPPTVANTITGSAKPTLSGAKSATSTTLTGWTPTVAAGDVLGFTVDSVATLTRATVSLTIQVP